jgi:uncharacterized membrane protein
MRFPIFLSVILFLALLILFPFLFGTLMIASLAKLHLTAGTAFFLVFAIILGGAINIPIKRIPRDDEVQDSRFGAYGFGAMFPQFMHQSRETVIAVNLGGCIIPSLLVLYELRYLMAETSGSLLAVLLASAVTIFAGYRFARPLPGIGIGMPALLMPLLAAILALLLAPDYAPPVAFIAGVTGPLIGADLLHLKDISKVSVGTLSIGGAGTFDGIILSGIVAAYLA